MSWEKIQVVALGGCGGMGQFAVRTALDFDFVDKIIIADLDEDRARKFADQCGSKASAIPIDIQDTKALIDLLSSSDVVMTTVGPYYRFGVPILKAAIEAGCHYIDINDDWEPTLEMLDLDEDAKKAGITALVGMGASPGISNMLAVKAMDQLDIVEKIFTGWGIGDSENEDFGEPGRGGTFGAAVDHWVYQFTGRIRVRRGGDFVEASPLQEIEIDYPGLGRGKVHTLGHPEPVTLPLYRPEVKDSYNVMDFPPSLVTILKTVAQKVNTGRLSVSEGAEWITSLENKGMSGLLFSGLGPRLLLALIRQAVKSRPSFPGDFALAIGLKDGKETTVGAHLKSLPFGGMEKMTMGAITGVPMALALKMFADGLVDRKGVFAPENLIEPDTFFNELAPLCTPECGSAEELVEIVTSS